MLLRLPFRRSLLTAKMEIASTDFFEAQVTSGLNEAKVVEELLAHAIVVEVLVAIFGVLGCFTGCCFGLRPKASPRVVVVSDTGRSTLERNSTYQPLTVPLLQGGQGSRSDARRYF